MTKAKPLIWCDPPVKARAVSKIRADWEPTIDVLRTRAGEWAMLRCDTTKKLADNLYTALFKQFPDCRFAVRKTGPDVYSVWGRANA